MAKQVEHVTCHKDKVMLTEVWSQLNKQQYCCAASLLWPLSFWAHVVALLVGFKSQSLAVHFEFAFSCLLSTRCAHGSTDFFFSLQYIRTCMQAKEPPHVTLVHNTTIKAMFDRETSAIGAALAPNLPLPLPPKKRAPTVSLMSASFLWFSWRSDDQGRGFWSILAGPWWLPLHPSCRFCLNEFICSEQSRCGVLQSKHVLGSCHLSFITPRPHCVQLKQHNPTSIFSYCRSTLLMTDVRWRRSWMWTSAI